MTHSYRSFAWVALAITLAASTASAQSTTGSTEPEQAPSATATVSTTTTVGTTTATATVSATAAPSPEPEAQQALITERRERPEYDNRDDPGPDAGEIMLWFPRILFAPVWLILDYGIRRPLGWFAETAERENWDAFVMDVFTWNAGRSGLIPTFFVAYGFQPSVGLVFFSNDEIAPGHSLSASASFGGIDYLQGGASYSVTTNERRLRLEIGGQVGRRPDRVFSGIGWDASASQWRFREAWYDAHVSLRADFWRQSRLTLRAGVDGHEFDANGYAALTTSTNSLESAIEQSLVPRPYGLDQPYVVARPRMEIAIDTREIEPAPGHGLRIDAHAEMAFDLHDPLGRRWVRWGGGVGGFVDLGDHRVLGLWGIVRFSDPLGTQPVPFTELIALGQEALLMQGFLLGQLRGRSATAMTLEYLYPIWAMLDGRLHVSVGNAFDAHLSDFLLERLRLSFGMGIATAGDPDDAIQLTIAAGTAPFVQGAGIESIQLVIGSRRGF